MITSDLIPTINDNEVTLFQSIWKLQSGRFMTARKTYNMKSSEEPFSNCYRIVKSKQRHTWLSRTTPTSSNHKGIIWVTTSTGPPSNFPHHSSRFIHNEAEMQNLIQQSDMMMNAQRHKFNKKTKRQLGFVLIFDIFALWHNDINNFFCHYSYYLRESQSHQFSTQNIGIKKQQRERQHASQQSIWANKMNISLEIIQLRHTLYCVDQTRTSNALGKTSKIIKKKFTNRISTGMKDN